ncbi:MAG: hypothetical protein JWQ35_1502 [Bacteriovoracaceae bacterium]|nr:hypothetical protein [Bacteriovoracaceae bacterium]
MKAFLIGVGFFCASINGLVAADTTNEEGSVELIFTGVKNCLVAPCPFYEVVSINKVKIEGYGANLINFDSEKSAASGLKKFSVTGSWRRNDREKYLEIVVTNWHATTGDSHLKITFDGKPDDK